MEFDKALAITLKDVRELFTDRPALLLSIVVPLILTMIIGVAFGTSGSTSSGPIKGIPVVFVNHDAGITLGLSKVNYGQNFIDAFKQTGELFKVLTSDDDEAAKTIVRDGNAAAAILIRSDFSDTLNPQNKQLGDKPFHLEVFRDAGAPIAAEIVSSVARQILNGFANANITIYAAFQSVTNPLTLVTQISGVVQDVVSQSAQGNLVKITTPQPSTPSVGSTAPTNLLQFFAPAMAVLFLNFTLAFRALTLIEERENWTLQRLLTSPTRRFTVLVGKFGGTYIDGVLQLAILIAATSIIGPLLGSKGGVWSSNVLGMILVTLAAVAASMGLGTLLAAVVRTRQQGTVVTGAVMTVIGLVGGAFTPGSAVGIISKLTPNYWATDAYTTLAQTNSISSVLPDIGALLLMFAVLFGLGLFIFNRQLEV